MFRDGFQKLKEAIIAKSNEKMAAIKKKREEHGLTAAENDRLKAEVTPRRARVAGEGG